MKTIQSLKSKQYSISMLIIGMLAYWVLPNSSWASTSVLATGSCGDNLTYTIYSDMTMVISGTGEMWGYTNYGNFGLHINDDYYQSIEKVIIEDGVTRIGGSAFMGCTSLTSIDIPNSVTRFGVSAFEDCTSLASIDIPNSVTIFGATRTFCGCSSLTSITIPYGVGYIGLGLFSSCTSLTFVEIPNSVTSIWEGAFRNCTSLTSIEIPNSVTSIDEDAFSGCTSLTSLTIPSSLTDIYYRAFNGCSGLTSIIVDSENTKFDSRDNCNAIIETETNTLIVGCKNTSIPSSVITIGYQAFFNCSNMTSVVIPNSVTSIESDAFYGCSGLTSITCESETPIAIENDVFEGIDKSNCILYVPFGSKTTYESAEYWNEFEHIVEYGGEPDTDISALDNVIYMEQTNGCIGGTMDISVKLKNSYAVRGFQFNLELPEGTTINSWRLSSNRLPTGATANDKMSSQNIIGNKINLACTLNYGAATFTGNDGEIATINVTFDEDMEVGSYPIYLTACDISNASNQDEDLNDIKATLILDDYLVGDTNSDGKVRIGDVSSILNYLVNIVSDNFNLKAADANGDGKIRIGDASTVLNIIVNQ